ncbi:MAG TPA: ABC transporter permease [Pseudonocardiaceae bacterium]
MIVYIIRRLIVAVLLLLVVCLATFFIFFVVPKLAGQTTDELAAQYVGRNPNPVQIHGIEVKLGLDKPILVQFFDFVKGLVVGAHYDNGPDQTYCPAPCFGYSFRSSLAVWPQMVSRIPVTLSLAIGAAIIWLVSGVATGILSALKKGSVWDRGAMTIALAGVSLPIFFTGQIALLLFRNTIPLFPNAGTYIPLTQSPVGWFENLILPWVTLAFLYAALYARITRAGMLETMSEDFIRTARAKGLVERKVVFKHGLRATVTPILTIFGLDLGLLVGGAVLTESVFSLPGLGYFAVQAISNNDLPEIMGVTLLAAFFVIVANLIVDVLYAVVDPRVRYS